MLDPFDDYLAAMSVTDPMRERLQQAVDLLTDIGVNGLDDIFLDQLPGEAYSISDPPQVFGAQVVVSEATPAAAQPGPLPVSGVWFFSGNLVMESPQIMTGPIALDQVVVEKNISRWETRRQAFRPGAASAESWLSVEFSTSSTVSGSLLATGVNCERLWRILTGRFIPNLVPAEQ